ncbi:MAG TPA: HEAT repeat domain-containing protein [Vicinamibacterales bacterium]|nr:HEAT repeat domain-containing protein [Vicinamibacterales bacterium]
MEETSPQLSSEESARLIEFARAFKAAARAVQMYPAGHPAIATTLERMADMTSSARLTAPLQITVLPDNLLINERAPARADAAVGELAELLHSHVIGSFTVNAGGDVEAWRNFLLLLGRSPDTLRSEGGIARVWATSAGQHLELREIDYSQVMRDRKGGKPAIWEHVIANCLQGDMFELDEHAMRELMEVARNQEQLSELLTELESRAASEGQVGVLTAALLRMFRQIVDAASKTDPEGTEPVLQNLANAVGRLAPDTVLGLLSHRGDRGERPATVTDVVRRMSDVTIAQFVARNVIDATTSTDRLAEAFQALVKDSEDRERLLALAQEAVASSPLGNTDGFEGVWNQIAEKLLTSYSDTSYVSDAYGRELSGARTRAISVEQTGDDPPERIAAWLSTVSTTALRALDLALVLDILNVETDDDRWGDMMTPVVALIEDLLLVGDFAAAAQLVEALRREAASGGSTSRRQYAVTAVDLVVAGPMMRHIVAHLSTISETQFEQVKAMCLSLGEVVVKPLAEALAGEERARPRQRLTSILVAFGVVGKRTVERLKASPNPVVRKTAIYLLREFGGSEALPELTELLDDSEAQVQREAVRAILNIGTEQSYEVLERALASGTERSRQTIMEAVSGVRDERATPLFAYIVRHVSHRGPLGEVYLRAIESLGTLRDPEAVTPLKEALYRGEWWAPRRNGILRSAAAAALARIGTAEAQAVLMEAAATGPRGVRTAVRPHLNAARPRTREQRERS